jgi:hypothetical protein
MKEWAKTHPPRAARIAELEFSATTVVLSRPGYQSKDLPSTLTLNVVRVFEPSPPSGAEPVEWLLYTTEPIDTPEDVANVVDIYRARWLIEECNKALKTGCRYEQHQFESRDALLTLLALTLPIACELLWLRASAREQPERPASEVLTPVQLSILAELGSRRLPGRCRPRRSHQEQRGAGLARPSSRHGEARSVRGRLDGCARGRRQNARPEGATFDQSLDVNVNVNVGASRPAPRESSCGGSTLPSRRFGVLT